MILIKPATRYRSLMIVAATALASLALAGCGVGSSASGVIEAVGAEVQYGDVLAQVGGVFVHVTSVISNPSTDPHNFEASPSVARSVAAAQLVVQNGAGYDSFMNQLESATSNKNRRVLTVASMYSRSAFANPHFWYSVPTMMQLSRVVDEELVQLDPTHAAYFRARERKFLASWEPVVRALANARHDFSHFPVATTEPVADYLLSAMDLVDETPFRFQADVMNGVDPSPQDIVTQQSLLDHHRVRALCFNAQVSSPVTAQLRHLAIQDHVAVVAMYETMPAGQHVQSWMLAEIDAIDAALRHGTSTTSLA